MQHQVICYTRLADEGMGLLVVVPRIIWEVRSDVTTGLGARATKLLGKEIKAKGNPSLSAI
jgi:hypothetical protein